ncbi:MAG: glycoside hydrolase family 57 [Nitrospirae bacterium]|nr:glycoside hydrolase family 57 [Nitrospirota bacterium]
MNGLGSHHDSRSEPSLLLPESSSVPLSLYTVFHLNLAYSSIEEDQRLSVIQRCYWPLLQIAKHTKIPIGIEMSGYTLEVMAALDPTWIKEFRELLESGICEIVGSGYAQIIGPLVPAAVNEANLRIGHEVYQQLLGTSPSIALVNEQAYSAGMIQHYQHAQYQALVMEWDNPARHHPEWNREWRYYPQYACGQHGEVIPVIWNKSIAFQKFQRYAHGELTLEEYLEYLQRHVASSARAFPLYGNDIEVFDFRPCRYETEASLHHEGEWRRIETLLENLHADARFQFVLPSQVLGLLDLPQAGHQLQLESSAEPIPVKKQGKYNVTRWAVTGRDDSGINASCWQCFTVLQERGITATEKWKELCYLWSSDFRTHITEKRWRQYKKRLETFRSHLSVPDRSPRSFAIGSVIALGSYRRDMSGCRIESCGHYLVVETDSHLLRLNCRRGLAIDALWFKHVSEYPLIRTLPHGYYDDIAMGADYYSGHLVLEAPGRPKITDLTVVEPEMWELEDGKGICVQAKIPSPCGPIHKAIIIGTDGEIGLEYTLEWHDIPSGALRLGHITLNPEAFDQEALWVRTHNGGYQEETFSLCGQSLDYGRSVSFLVSSAGALAMTEGALAFGDNLSAVSIHSDQGSGYKVGLVTMFPVGHSYFSRMSFSTGEFDDTTREGITHSLPLHYNFSLRAHRVDQTVSCVDSQQSTLPAEKKSLVTH